MIATDRRVFVFKKGMFSGAMFGKKLASWDHATLNGIQLETGAISGVIALHAPGIGSQDLSYWANGKDSPQSSPHALALGRNHFDPARQGVAIIRELIADAHRPHSQTQGPQTQSVANELRELADRSA